MASRLEEKGYPTPVIEKGIEKAKIRKPQDSKKEDIIVFSTQHNPNNPNVNSMIRDMYNALQNNPEVKGFDKKLVFAKRRAPNLKNMLTRASYNSEKNHRVSKCGKNCFVCKLIIEGTTFKFSEEKVSPFK